MTRTRSLLNLALLALMLSSTPAVLTKFPAQAQFQAASLGQNIPSEWGIDANFTPPQEQGRPGGREGGATRSPCVLEPTPLTVLVPESSLGKTAEPYPTFLAYIPKNQAERLKFTLETEELTENTVYEAEFALTQQPDSTDSITKPGLVSFALPAQAGFPPLEIGQNYRWSFTLICPGGGTIFARGWVQRVEKDPDLEQALKGSSLSDRVDIYIRNGLWNDALAALDELHRSQPSDSSITDALKRLLQAAKLDKVVDAL